MSKTVIYKRDQRGQWMYKIFYDDGSTAVDWQYGSFELATTKAEATDRFGPLKEGGEA